MCRIQKINIIWLSVSLGNPNKISFSLLRVGKSTRKTPSWFHQIKNSFHISLTLSQCTKKWGISSVSSQYEHIGVSFNFISKSFLLQLIILCIILNCNDCSFVSLKQRYGRLRISGHSSSGIRPGDIDCHFCKPAGFTYLFLMNWLYNIFVATVTRGVSLPQKLTKGTLTLVVTAFFFFLSICANSKEDFAWFVKHWESYS